MSGALILSWVFIARRALSSDAATPRARHPQRLTKPLPGTKQVCFFRDSYDDLTKTGLAIYGLSADSGKANTTFRDKQKLPYPLLCDPAATLIGAIGLKKVPKGTQRGVFVVDKLGKVLVAQPGSPQGTVDVVKGLVEGGEEAVDGKQEDAKV